MAACTTQRGCQRPFATPSMHRQLVDAAARRLPSPMTSLAVSSFSRLCPSTVFLFIYALRLRSLLCRPSRTSSSAIQCEAFAVLPSLRSPLPGFIVFGTRRQRQSSWGSSPVTGIYMPYASSCQGCWLVICSSSWHTLFSTKAAVHNAVHLRRHLVAMGKSNILSKKKIF